MPVATNPRQVKNVAYNFSDAQVKVREATSNDPWGPSTGLMSEIADLSNNPAAFTEIMSIIWKRLNGHGKNWRHVYKSLVLLDFLIKNGSDSVVDQCRLNIYSIETLRDFQHVEEGRDQGMNVREKANQLACLVRDGQRLAHARIRFVPAKYRMPYDESSSNGVGFSLRRTQPRNQEEADEQFALALAESEQLYKKEMLVMDDATKQAERLAHTPNPIVSSCTLSQAAVDDLISLLGMEQAPMAEPTQQQNLDVSQTLPTQAPPPLYSAMPVRNDHWSVVLASRVGWDAAPTSQYANTADPFAPLGQSTMVPTTGMSRLNTKTPETFLGENSSLVNLDNLMGGPAPAASAVNPFLLGSTAPPAVNPFTAAQRKSPTLNEMRAGSTPVIPPTNSSLPQSLQKEHARTNPSSGL